MIAHPTPPLEIESLLTADQRRVTVAEHGKFRESISSLAAFDQLEDAIRPFRAAQTRSNRETSRLNALLDDILVEQLRIGAFEETGGMI